jgi:hypothetical protein
LSNQILTSKTYPTNSGFPLIGAEKVQREDTGGNVMQPLCSSILMLELMKGDKILPTPIEESREYMKSMLFHQPKIGQSTIGYGLPSGTILYNKLGLAYE